MSATGGWRRARRSAVALICGWSLLDGTAATRAATVARQPSTTHTVIIEGVKYAPDALTVKLGDTVVWVNKDPYPHTVTAPGSFDSRSIAAGVAWKYVARKTGEYAYTCTLHPNMNGKFKVE